MSEGNDQEQGQGKKRLSLRSSVRQDSGHTVDAGSIRQSFSHGRTKVVQVEVRKKRGASGGNEKAPGSTTGVARKPAAKKTAGSVSGKRALTASELATRQRVLDEQRIDIQRKEVERREQEKIAILSAAEEAKRREEEKLQQETEAALAAKEAEKARLEAAAVAVKAEVEKRSIAKEAATKQQTAPEARKPQGQSLTARRTKVSHTPIPGEVTLAPTPRRVEPLAKRAVMSSRPVAKTTPVIPGMENEKNAGYGGRNKADKDDKVVKKSNDFVRARPELRGDAEGEDSDGRRGARRGAGAGAGPGAGVGAGRKAGSGRGKSGDNRRSGKIDIQAAIEGEDDKVRSLASVRRQRERERRQAELEKLRADQVKVVRDVTLPETITVQELANRMAARQGDVIKALMKMGVMATVNQSLDADTAELVIEEFGHRVHRVADSDVELGIEKFADTDENQVSRPPVVTVMGHVDHGKTSLLDALRTTDTARGEAGGITQHIGAYQIKLPSGARITFLDTPGHEAFTAMRSRGASVTDIVVLVVAADDGVMPQTIEAIKHAKAAGVPIIVAINKCDLPGANPDRVRQELLQHEIVVEQMGGDTQDVEVSAKKRIGLDKLEEAIILLAELQELKANPNRIAEGAVIESRLDKGRGPVATLLVQKGTLNKGDVVVAGAEWGRVRAMLDDKNVNMKHAGPSAPVELLGLTGVPRAGEPFVVVDSESKAREISEFRQRKVREKQAAVRLAARGTLDQMLERIQAGEQKEVAVLIKADVQGSAEAIQTTVIKLEHEEIKVNVISATVGQITESDVQLAKASNAIIVAFNVRATVQARELAQQENVGIHYYSIIYQVIDDIEKIIKGRIAPKQREKFLGYAEIRKVFSIGKTVKVAGCYVTQGVVRRGCGVRLLRDNVVIHAGNLSQLKRFKDDVKEVTHEYECGLSFAGFNDLREGDVVECYEMETIEA
ncbi:translation initiation factor IF-2 [Commensalibacter papalotli (ex Servin-Garciduenas et al. 2014)]|uniref:Translation initiation factor IF-2 n=1 Tax=Commensalibacter papalotli (ex Servin-Garciduenas et al. 2014) TaxID=1208583 RepID=W7DKG6_9PROT|nr:translation initiation factor IF-2 [Commensalibacter papalotli (ex Servin-Garciduenas et al. 2014)]EUK17832.1 translation initiation factor IF-2 [Commensalibacter papalotli (ex Servin-Garciduenas et al. 2014)]